MIAEQLIRSGQAFVQGVTSPATLLKIISDSDDDKTKNFWQHIVIIEVDLAIERVTVQPTQSWGTWHAPEGGKKPVFQPDERAVLAPIFLPTGGIRFMHKAFTAYPFTPFGKSTGFLLQKAPTVSKIFGA